MTPPIAQANTDSSIITPEPLENSLNILLQEKETELIRLKQADFDQRSLIANLKYKLKLNTENNKQNIFEAISPTIIHLKNSYETIQELLQLFKQSKNSFIEYYTNKWLELSQFFKRQEIIIYKPLGLLFDENLHDLIKLPITPETDLNTNRLITKVLKTGVTYKGVILTKPVVQI